jgi:Gamma-glutamyl cyclotransferase, AIG2-like
MDRRAPVYDGLVAQDREKRFHRNRGQLGVALATQTHPDFDAAEKMLTEAIEVRDRDEKNADWRNYEFYRAYSLIGKTTASQQPTSPEVQKRIVADLKEARAGDTYLQSRIKETPPSPGEGQDSRESKNVQMADEYRNEDINLVREWLLKFDKGEYENWRPLLYFAYGSNMFEPRLTRKDRAPSATPLTIAKLADHRFDFSKTGKDGTGKGNIREHKGAEVWGVLFQMSCLDKTELDKAEKGYDEVKVTVTDPSGKHYRAFTYAAVQGLGCPGSAGPQSAATVYRCFGGYAGPAGGPSQARWG